MPFMALEGKTDTTARWEGKNPVLASDEIAFELTTAGARRMKIGDGVTAWNSLPYFEVAPKKAVVGPYTVTPADMQTVLEFTNTGGETECKVPANLPLGSVFEVFQAGDEAGKVKIIGVGVTIRPAAGVKTAKLYATVSVRIRTATEAVVSGEY